MNTRKAMSEAIAVLDAPGSQGVGRTMYLKTRWTKVEEPSRSGRLLSRAGGQDTCKRVYRGAPSGGKMSISHGCGGLLRALGHEKLPWRVVL